MTTVSFEWRIDHRPDGVYVIERLCGSEARLEFGPMDARIADSFVRARRESVRRQMYQRGGVKLLTH